MQAGWYVYRGRAPLGEERLGSDGKAIWRDLKTAEGAHKRARRIFGPNAYRLYRFTNFYDDKTFREV